GAAPATPPWTTGERIPPARPSASFPSFDSCRDPENTSVESHWCLHVLSIKQSTILSTHFVRQKSFNSIYNVHLVVLKPNNRRLNACKWTFASRCCASGGQSGPQTSGEMDICSDMGPCGAGVVKRFRLRFARPRNWQLSAHRRPGRF